MVVLWRELDSWISSITMYRLVAWGLSILAAIAIAFGFLGVLPFSGWALWLSIVILATASYVGNKLLATIWNVPTNSESYLITALILFFIVPPATTAQRGALLALIALIAMTSKYALSWRGKHIFNPAAIAVMITGLAGLLPATWWIGTGPMLAFVVVLGLLVARKIRRLELVGVFAAVAIATMLVVGGLNGQLIGEVLAAAFLTWPLVFFATIMLTEPSTIPPRHYQQLVYGGMVAILFAGQFQVGWVVATPELALVVGNIYAFAVSQRYRLRLKLKRVDRLSERVYDFVFEPNRQPHYRSGQYLEVTLPHRQTDGRGNRRSFTIASAPSESELHLGIKFYEPSSSFKKALRALKPGDEIVAGQLAGSFLLPNDPTQKLVMVAGGIGVTPFRSMIKHLIDSHQRRDIVLLYAVSDPRELSYVDIIKQAQDLGVRLVPVLGVKNRPIDWDGHIGLVDSALIQTEIPDYKQRLFYLSGPQVMVDSTKRVLHTLGVKRRDIKTDYFSGY